ncbi:HNH endonuclease signature motif containing protein [Parabacteroides sp.]
MFYIFWFTDSNILIPQNVLDRTWKRYTKLFVLSFVGIRKGRALWRCRCDCGNEVIVPGNQLTSGLTKSCGCLKLNRPNTKVHCHCDWCGKPISMKRYSYNRAKYHYCSVKCSSMHKTVVYKGKNNHQYGLKGVLNSSFKNGNLKVKNNSLIEDMVYVGEWYKGNVHGRVKAHRYLFENNYYIYDEAYFDIIDGWHYLKPKIEVHHIDFNHNNNDITNLIPLTKSEHISLHNKYREKDRDYKTGKFKKSKK